jgi:2-dehydropantoate 2-reductase
VRILIEGVGGVGGIVAARLTAAGFNPVLVTGNPQIAEAINQNGISAKTTTEEFNVLAKAVVSLDDLDKKEPFDAAFLIMKANPVVESAKKTIPFLRDDGGYVVTFQNGVVEDAVAAAVGAERVVSGIIGWGATMHAPGVYEKTSGGAIHIGELDGKIGECIQKLENALEVVCPVVVSGNIRGALWSKMAINCMITTVGALTGQLLGEMLSERRVRQAFLVIYREVLDTAQAAGIKVERIAANPRLFYLPPNAGMLNRFIKDVLMKILGRRYKKLKSSMLQSLERGRPTEIDYLNGYVVETAKRFGVPVPLNALVTKMIKEIESGKRKIERRNMDELLAEMG